VAASLAVLFAGRVIDGFGVWLREKFSGVKVIGRELVMRVEFIAQVVHRVRLAVSGGGDGGAGGGEKVCVHRADKRQKRPESGQLSEQDGNIGDGVPESDRGVRLARLVEMVSGSLQIDEGVGLLLVHCRVKASFASGDLDRW
jgi:hypothetical protein